MARGEWQVACGKWQLDVKCATPAPGHDTLDGARIHIIINKTATGRGRERRGRGQRRRRKRGRGESGKYLQVVQLNKLRNANRGLS